jgi:subtilase family serine protease
MFNGKPAWQRLVYNAAKDQSRDIPDVSLFAGSYGNHTWAIVCTAAYPCAPGFTTPTQVEGGTSLSAPMFAGIQALIDEGLVNRGLPVKQGNVAPTLYALAQDEYGGTTGEVPDSLANCDSDNGRTGTASCVFHNVTRGSISTECDQQAPTVLTSECFFVGTIGQGSVQVGLTSTDANKYNAKTSAYAARPGWSFASGLGSVDAANLLKAWSSFVGAKAAAR